jgi:hypothetical protein
VLIDVRSVTAYSTPVLESDVVAECGESFHQPGNDFRPVALVVVICP